MKNLKLIGTWFLWCLLAPCWRQSVRYRDVMSIPSEEKLHEHFKNLLSALGILGESARDFDDQVRDRLLMLLYWVTKSKGISLDMKESANDIMWKINANTTNTCDQFMIRQNTTNPFQFEYRTDVVDWEVPSFLDGTIWSKTLSEDNERLAYLVNIMLNGKEVK